MMSAQKTTPCLWFDLEGEQAVAHYVSVFRNARVLSTTHYGEAGPGPVGAGMTCLFEIEGQQFLALSGGPQFSFHPAIDRAARVTRNAPERRRPPERNG